MQINYIYIRGISFSNLRFSFQSLLRTADQLKIKGLCESPEEKENTETPTLPLIARGYAKIRRTSSPKHFKPIDANRRQTRSRKNALEKQDLQNREENVEDKDELELDNSSAEDDDMPASLSEESRKRKLTHTQTKPLNMSNHGILAGQVRTEFSYVVNLLLWTMHALIHRTNILLVYLY